MAFPPHQKDDISWNIQLGSRETEDAEDQNSAKFILKENSTEELNEPAGDASRIQRTRFTAFQKTGLEEAFAFCQYVRSHECQVLAERLGLSVKTVQVWFRNKRFKIRKSARQERQYHRLQPNSSNFRNTKFPELGMQQASSSTYMVVDSRIPYVLHPHSPFVYRDDYLMPARYSPTFTAVTSAQSSFMYNRSHPYQ